MTKSTAIKPSTTTIDTAGNPNLVSTTKVDRRLPPVELNARRARKRNQTKASKST